MSTRYFWSTAVFLLFTATFLRAQSTFPAHGLHKNTPSTHAFVNCTVVVAPGEVIEDGVLIIRDGVVENVGKGLSIPNDALRHDLKGSWIFPGFIDIYADYGLKKPKRKPQAPGTPPQYKRADPHPLGWNEAVKPEFETVMAVEAVAEKRKKWRNAGFTSLNIVPRDGIFRGQSALMSLGERSPQQELLAAHATATMSFRKGVSRQQYPSSLMGAIALIRQTLLDAQWYATVKALRADRPGMPATETNLSLEALLAQQAAGRPIIFETDDWQNVLRAQRIAQEFDQKFIYKTVGDSYQRIEAIRQTGAPLVVPINFPKAYDVNDMADARNIPLRKMLHWEAAPTNPARLAQAKIPFALTADGLKSPDLFWKNLHKAIAHGLSPEKALEALTLAPARMLGEEKRLGTLDPGKIANFSIFEKDPFSKRNAQLHASWIGGKHYQHKPIPDWDPRGKYQLSIGNETRELHLQGTALQPKAKVISGTDTIKGVFIASGRQVTLNFSSGGKKDKDADPKSAGPKGKDKANGGAKFMLSGIADGSAMQGSGIAPDGRRLKWKASPAGSLPELPDTTDRIKPAKVDGIPAVNFPNMAYGQTQIPSQGTFLIQNATIWTNTDDGVLASADVLIHKGKIKSIGPKLLVPPKAIKIDGKGMHLTPGIIDEHSHIAVSRGVNEGTHAISAEVSIADVVNAQDVNIYRQLSGGVTTSQLLHGSANPIGGQSAIIKLRWGALPEEMKMETARPFIKFALGENVKQSNWGSNMRTRYPQTRLGVEQVFRDAFQSARDYEAAWKAYDPSIGNGSPPRRDLQQETVLQILNSERFVTCHSYQQAEITMLMRVAESFGFRINTFTHVLEGYKIADKIRAHGASASTFSDWWAYKYEVIDAIPYNAALLTQKGVNVCINSDDAEMGRRLNQEAAKAMKYGGVTEEEALKMVTLNPAKALRIDQYVGSIAQGMDADVVLWTDHPLSVYAQASRTFVDGRLYFDQEKDKDQRRRIDQERRRLISKMMKAPAGGKKKFQGKSGPKLYHCDSMEEEHHHEEGLDQ